MSHNMHQSFRGFVSLALTIGLTAGSLALRAADAQNTTAQKEQELIRVLESNSTPAEKAITCKRLAVYGSPKAVPALAPLLADPELNSWARIALEAIPGAASKAALRKAMTELEGRQLIGVINSIGVRRDPQAVRGLIRKLNGSEPQVACAAAEALGRIGGDQAARALGRSLNRASGEVQSATALGMVLCAENYMAEGDYSTAAGMYDAVRAASVPRQRVLEATRGAILARQSEGIPLLLEVLRSSDRDLFGIGLRTARELPGHNVSEALASEMMLEEPDRQASMLLALADRNDAVVLPAVLAVAQEGPTSLRLVAVKVLDRLGNLSCVPVLLEAAIDQDTELAQAARLSLARLEGKAIDNDLLARLPQASAAMRQALIDLAARRYLVQAIPVILDDTLHTDAAIRRAAVQALGVLAGEEQIDDLVARLQTTTNPEERVTLERALTAICNRVGRAGASALLPLMQNADPSIRIIGIHLLASVGGPQALSAVTQSIDDEKEAVRDEAVRTLSTWPSNWPEDVAVAETLLALAKSGKKYSHKVQGLRGYLQYVQETNALTRNEKLARVQQAFVLIERTEEKRQAIAVLNTLPTKATLELLMKLADDSAVVEEACLALVNIAGQDELPAAAKETRRQALQLVNVKSGNADTKKRAQVVLRSL